MTRIVFVSCANVELRPVQPAWDAIAADPPDLLMLLGDNTYMSWTGTKWELERLQQNYEAQFKIPAFKKLIDTVPTLAIWDDHDLGPNDSCGAELMPQQLADSRALFNHYLAKARNDNLPHMHCTYDIGEVRVIMLDVRTYRTLSTSSAPTVLGGVQEDWLWKELANNPKPYTIVASGTVTDDGLKGHRLSDYKDFYKRLQSALRPVPPGPKDSKPPKARKVLLLSGDIHKNRWKNHSGFFEATSSGVACVWGDKKKPIDNWGLLTFGAEELTVDLRGRTPSHAHKHRLRLRDWTEIS